MKYKTRTIFSKTFNLIGIVSVSLGVVVIAWGFLMLLCTRSFKIIGLTLVGVGLLFFGSFFLSPGTFGFYTHGEEVPRGDN